MKDTVDKILAKSKGVLALDWSPSTTKKQFEKVNLISTPELNRVYREMLVTSPSLNDDVSGVILHDETIHQKLSSGESFPEFLKTNGIVVGVRGDQEYEKYKDAEQNITIGLDGLAERVEEYAKLGIAFTKWRAGYKISDIYPSKDFIEESVNRLVEFAKVSHQFNMVPFVEPDVEIKGMHTTTRCAEITGVILERLFESLQKNQNKNYQIFRF